MNELLLLSSFLFSSLLIVAGSFSRWSHKFHLENLKHETACTAKMKDVAFVPMYLCNCVCWCIFQEQVFKFSICTFWNETRMKLSDVYGSFRLEGTSWGTFKPKVIHHVFTKITCNKIVLNLFAISSLSLWKTDQTCTFLSSFRSKYFIFLGSSR